MRHGINSMFALVLLNIAITPTILVLNKQDWTKALLFHWTTCRASNTIVDHATILETSAFVFICPIRTIIVTITYVKCWYVLPISAPSVSISLTLPWRRKMVYPVQVFLFCGVHTGKYFQYFFHTVYLFKKRHSRVDKGQNITLSQCVICSFCWSCNQYFFGNLKWCSAYLWFWNNDSDFPLCCIDFMNYVICQWLSPPRKVTQRVVCCPLDLFTLQQYNTLPFWQVHFVGSVVPSRKDQQVKYFANTCLLHKTNECSKDCCVKLAEKERDKCLSWGLTLAMRQCQTSLVAFFSCIFPWEECIDFQRFYQDRWMLCCDKYSFFIHNDVPFVCHTEVVIALHLWHTCLQRNICCVESFEPNFKCLAQCVLGVEAGCCLQMTAQWIDLWMFAQ